MIQNQCTFSVSFYQRLDKTDANNTAPVFMRVTVNGERAEIATNRRFDVKRWSNGKPIGSTKEAKIFADYLHSLREKIYDIQRNLLDRNEIITASKIKQFYQGKGQSVKTLIDAFEIHNNQMQSLIGKDFKRA